MTLAPMRMRTTLLLALLSISVGLTALSLALVHTSLQRQIRTELAADLDRSVLTFRNLQAQRREMLRREAALLADLPSLKALMTSNDALTIRDAGHEFADVSGSDLFALASSAGSTLAVFENGRLVNEPALAGALNIWPGDTSGSRYYVSGSKLYEVSVQPLYFGSPQGGSRLGYVATGYAIDERLSREVSQASAAEIAFAAQNRIICSTLDMKRRKDFLSRGQDLLSEVKREEDIVLGSEHYLASSVRLSRPGDPPVQLIALKSYDEASRYLHRLNEVLVGLGALVFLVGSVIAMYVSSSITRPLESLAAGARALGSGNYEAHLDPRGAREVRELSASFDGMRTQLRKTQQELVEAEQLATIGRMASSISHDLRHYLSAVYANAEFLGDPRTGAGDRAELLAEVKLGVEGMTDLIESLLSFSRTGQQLQLTSESLPAILERAVTLVRMHREAERVSIEIAPSEPIEVWVDGVKIERAIYNLLLNACQAANAGTARPVVRVSLVQTEDWIRLLVEDNGHGVPTSIIETLFQPFVSKGKHSGAGLGLTIASRIAEEHGGAVKVETSLDGQTIFSLSLAKSTLRNFDPSKGARNRETVLTSD